MAECRSLEKVHSDIEKQLECGICLERFHEPKKLKCNHMFCKECLDKLLEFCIDGNAFIVCPMKCKEVTTITCEQTVNDLDGELYVQGILESINARSQDYHESKKCGEENCEHKISTYCYNCKCMLCHTCQSIHRVKHQSNSFASVKYHQRTKEVVVICDEHKTTAGFICLEHGCNSKIICMYCRERNHRNHYMESIHGKGLQLIDLPAVVAEYNSEVVDVNMETPSDKDIDWKLLKKIALKSHHGKYVCAEPSGKVVADRSKKDAWETFKIEHLGDNKIALKTHHDKYLCAERNGQAVANRENLSLWEMFYVETQVDGKISLKSHHNKYLCAEKNGRVVADRQNLDWWEKFSVESCHAEDRNQ